MHEALVRFNHLRKFIGEVIVDIREIEETLKKSLGMPVANLILIR